MNIPQEWDLEGEGAVHKWLMHYLLVHCYFCDSGAYRAPGVQGLVSVAAVQKWWETVPTSEFTSKCSKKVLV